MTHVEAKAMSIDFPKLEWTGERFLPWIGNATISYEHLHRYAFAARFARNKRVLDLGTGEGYGANILAQAASSVIGVDIDSDAIQHATATYRRNNLAFVAGSFARVPVSADHSFDLIVCFEAIEHIRDHDELLSEVMRLLKPDGLFMVSTPNKTAYRKDHEDKNHYHVNELDTDEFQQLLNRYFCRTTFLGQRIHPGSSIWPLASTDVRPVEELAVERNHSEFEFITNDKRVPLYIIGLASNGPGNLATSGSVLIDSSDELLNEIERAVRENLERLLAYDRVKRLQDDLDWHVEKLAEMSRLAELHASNLRDTQTLLTSARAELGLVYGSKSWWLFNKWCSVRDNLLPTGSLRRQFLHKIARRILPNSK